MHIYGKFFSSGFLFFLGSESHKNKGKVLLGYDNDCEPFFALVALEAETRVWLLKRKTTKLHLLIEAIRILYSFIIDKLSDIYEAVFDLGKQIDPHWEVYWIESADNEKYRWANHLTHLYTNAVPKHQVLYCLTVFNKKKTWIQYSELITHIYCLHQKWRKKVLNSFSQVFTSSPSIPGIVYLAFSFVQKGYILLFFCPTARNVWKRKICRYCLRPHY